MSNTGIICYKLILVLHLYRLETYTSIIMLVRSDHA
jgi:hypothetical protein